MFNENNSDFTLCSSFGVVILWACLSWGGGAIPELPIKLVHCMIIGPGTQVLVVKVTGCSAFEK